METRGPSSNPEMFLFGKSPRAKGDCLGGQMVVAGITFRFCHQAVSKRCFSRSQSRMRGDFLWYEEQIEMSQEERDAKAARRCASHRRRHSHLLIPEFAGRGKLSTLRSLLLSDGRTVRQKQEVSSNKPTAPSFDTYQGVASGTWLHTFPYVNSPIKRLQC
jgi:hypothetical protein